MGIQDMVAREEPTNFANDIKLFGLYDKQNDGKCDLSLVELISYNTPKTNVYVPHTAGRYQVKRFRKTQCPIVERLTNNRNPVALVLEAVSNAGPREDSARAGSGG